VFGPDGTLKAPVDGYRCDVAVLSREEFDAIEFDAASTGDYRSAAERMSQLAATGVSTESMPRAEAYIRAGEQWLLADDPAAAADGFRRAMADGGPANIDPRVPLCRALFQLGKRDEAYALISALKAEGRSDPRACEMIMDMLVEQSDLNEALDWATVGVELILQGARRPAAALPGDPAETADPYTDLTELLRLRYRIRNDLRLGEDEYDRMLNP
jgi:Tetratricopeptide repeat